MLTPQEVYEQLGYKQARYWREKTIAISNNFMYTTAIIVGIDEVGFEYRYCYENLMEAIDSFGRWTDEMDHPPGNWIKRKGLGEDYPNPDYVKE